jgi:hypothetical protein
VIEPVLLAAAGQPRNYRELPGVAGAERNAGGIGRRQAVRAAKQAQSCAGFRRTGNPRRGGYDSIMAGILCAPAGRTLSDDQFARFIDRVRLQ